MGGASARRKGHNFEREVVNVFKPLFPDTQRCYQFTNGKLMEVYEPDVKSGKLAIECKRMKKANIKAALKQAELACSDQNGYLPASVCKDDFERPIISMYLPDFIKYTRELQNKNDL